MKGGDAAVDEQTFAERYRLLYRDLYRFALCVTGNVHDAEDAVAEGALAAYEHRGQLRRAGAFKSWLFQIVANRCRRRLAMGKRCEAVDPEVMDAAQPSPLDGADVLAVRAAFAALGECDRLVVGLSVFGGYSSREIGAMMQMNPSTVRSRRKRALAQMASLLEGGVR